MRKCFISRNYKSVNSAGGKAKTDIERIMEADGFTNLGRLQTHYKGKVIDFFLTLSGVLLAMARIKRGDVIVLQYPMKKYYERVCDVAHAKGAKIITQIHDLNAFRSKRLTTRQEIDRLNHSDAVIAHNDTMKEWLSRNGCKAELLTLGIFDYLTEEPIVSKRENPGGEKLSMFFVGNLNPKSNPFAYDLTNRMKVHKLYLYGNNYHKELLDESKQGQYLGYAVDHELMKSNMGDFGLSWYGESLDEGKGKIGEYMAYNNPHKVSLYLRCHAPVIVSKTAGLAKFVEDNGIGLCVDSLQDIERILDNISPEKYDEMRRNAIRVSDKIAAGHYFRTAVNKAIDLLRPTL